MRNDKILIFLFSVVLLTSFVQAVVAPNGLVFGRNATAVYDKGNFSLNWTAGDADPAINYTLYVYADGVLYKKDWNSSVTGYNFDNWTEANYTFKVAALNTSGVEGANSTNVSLTVDRTAPTVTLPFYANATKKRNATSLTLNISVTDSGSGLTGSACIVDVNGTNQTVAITNGMWCNTTSGGLTGLADGNRTIRVYVNDTINNLAIYTWQHDIVFVV